MVDTIGRRTLMREGKFGDPEKMFFIARLLEQLKEDIGDQAKKALAAFEQMESDQEWFDKNHAECLEKLREVVTQFDRVCDGDLDDLVQTVRQHAEDYSD